MPQTIKNEVSGVVFDSITGEPIPYVEIFVSGTTIGCISNSQGKYKIKLPFVPCVMVADHVSYGPFIAVIKENFNFLNIKLLPSVKSIEEVSVLGKDKRKQNLRFFYTHFIGNEKSKIRILNDSILFFNKTENEFNAYSNEPLIIINKKLGYQIKLILKQFLVHKVEQPNGKQIALDSSLGTAEIKTIGFYHYENLPDVFPDKYDKYEENRRSYYFGSIRHFQKAIYNGNLADEGFRIIHYPLSDTIQDVFVFDNDKISNNANEKSFYIKGDSIKVVYNYMFGRYPVRVDDENIPYQEESIIYPSGEISKIRSNGTSDNINFMVKGAMAPRSFAHSLPDDYVP